MTVVIKQTDTPDEMNKKIRKAARAAKNAKPRNKFDPFKYLGKRILKGVFGDGLAYQKKVRDEWNG